MNEPQSEITMSTIKVAMIKDLFKHCKKNNIMFTKKLLIKYGFFTPEIMDVYNIYLEEIKMINEFVEENLRNKIKELTLQLEQCKTEKSNNVPIKHRTTFIKLKNGYDIISYNIIKDKTKQTSKNFCTNKNISILKKLLKNNTSKKYPRLEYKQVVDLLINEHKILCDPDAFNGGKNRSKFYFPLYYNPMKVLEHLGIIKSNKRGQIIVIYK